MTAARIYGLIWLFVLAAAGISYLTGSINAMTLPIFGFIFSTLAAGGFVAVLPVWLKDHYSPKTSPANFLYRGFLAMSVASQVLRLSV